MSNYESPTTNFHPKTTVVKVLQQPSNTEEEVTTRESTALIYPLTSVWTPPCAKTTIFQQKKSDPASCFPPEFISVWSGMGYYSPAICPHGYTVGCQGWIKGNTAAQPLLAPQLAPVKDETAMVCVPNEDAKSTDLVPALEIRWKAEDLVYFETHPLTPGAPPTTITRSDVTAIPIESESGDSNQGDGSPFDTGGSNSRDYSSGEKNNFSVGVVAGITSGIVAGVVLLVLVGLLCRRYRKQKLFEKRGNTIQRYTIQSVTTLPMSEMIPGELIDPDTGKPPTPRPNTTMSLPTLERTRPVYRSSSSYTAPAGSSEAPELAPPPPMPSSRSMHIHPGHDHGGSPLYDGQRNRQSFAVELPVPDDELMASIESRTATTRLPHSGSAPQLGNFRSLTPGTLHSIASVPTCPSIVKRESQDNEGRGDEGGVDDDFTGDVSTVYSDTQSLRAYRAENTNNPIVPQRHVSYNLELYPSHSPHLEEDPESHMLGEELEELRQRQQVLLSRRQTLLQLQHMRNQELQAQTTPSQRQRVYELETNSGQNDIT